MSVPHPTWLGACNDYYARGQGPAMGHETVFFYILVRPLEFSQSWLSGFRPVIYTLHMSKIYMSTFVNQWNKSRRHIDSSSIIAHLAKFWYTAGDIAKMWCQEVNICLYIYIHNHPLNNRYGFSLSIGNTKNHVATLTCLEWHTEIC